MVHNKHENPMSVRSKSALSQAILRLMMTRPFDEIQITDITRKACLSRQTFYTNFDRKEDILIYLIDGLFERYKAVFTREDMLNGNFIVEYFFFWDSHRDFLALLFTQGLGYLFQDRNRAFFAENSVALDMLFRDELMGSYVKASLAGLTYELMLMWLLSGSGLSIDALAVLSKNLISGKIFFDKAS